MSGDCSIVAVIPALDAAATLDRCLESVIAAGFAPQEVVLVDDGCTDATLAIARGRGVRIVTHHGNEGAGAARNAGVAASDAPLILFVDADVALHADVRGRIAAFFAGHPDHAGVIGSYDDAPPAPGTLSRIRNLLHHHVHQHSGGDVASFWTGCGALRRAQFERAGGFEPGHKLEDVELGMKLARQGDRVLLDPAIQCTHLKRWTLRSMVRADLLHRALPWSRMLLDPRNRDVGTALNAGGRGQASVIVAALASLALPLALFAPVAAGALWLGAVAMLVGLHAGFLGLVARRLGRLAAVQAIGVLWVHHLCAGAGFSIAVVQRITRPRRPHDPSPSPPPRDSRE